MALTLLEKAVGPRTAPQSPLHWDDDGTWKEDFYNVEKMSAGEFARRRAEFGVIKRVAKERQAATNT